MPLSRTFYTHALTTVRIATQTTSCCVALSGCNQSGSIALRNRGTLVLASARDREGGRERDREKERGEREGERGREISLPHSPKTLPQGGGKLADTPCTRAKRTTLIEYKQSSSERILQVLRAAMSKVQHNARRCTNSTRHSSARIYRQPPYQGTSGECMMTLRHWDLPRARQPLISSNG